MADTETFEEMLTGGHPNSLGRTDEVAGLVIADKARLEDLYQTYFSTDEVVRLRVSSAMKRVTIARTDWVMGYMDRLQSEIAAIDQASTQWTLALIFDMTKGQMSAPQHQRAMEIMKQNIESHPDWIVLNNCMKVLSTWAKDDADLRVWLRPQLERLTGETRKSVAGQARKALALLAKYEAP